jgi:ribokinase
MTRSAGHAARPARLPLVPDWAEVLGRAPAPRVVVVGSVNVDLVARAERRPGSGETVRGSAFAVFAGGKGANQALAAARLGASVGLVGRVGRDDFAAVGLSELDAAGVDTAAVAHDPERHTGVAMIVVDDHGENSIIVVAGANGDWSNEDVERAAAAAARAQVLLLQLEIPQPVSARAARAARAAGATVVLDPAPAQPLDAELLANVDVLTPNAHEAAELTHARGAPPEVSAERLRALGVPRVVVTLGEQGALYLDPELGHARAFPVEPVDTTAAGDAFNGALAVGLGRGLGLADAVRLGCAAGALATTRLGAQPSLPSASELLALLRLS